MWTVYLHAMDGKGLYRIDCPIDPKPFGPHDTRLFSRRQCDPNEYVGSGVAIAAWAGKVNGKPIVADTYRPEDVATLGDLLGRAADYGCLPFLEGKLHHIANRLRAEPCGVVVPVAILLLPRRPYAVTGSDSVVEICSYLIEVSTAADLEAPQTAVRLVAHRETVSTAVLRRTSGDDPAAPEHLWTLLGCGSVGSKLALHMARTGRGPTILVDKDTLEPHNFARHAALPFNPDRQGLFYMTKTSALSGLMEKLGRRPTCYRSDALVFLVDDANRVKIAPPQTEMIINTTGSAVIREAYAHADWVDRPRLVEACLLGAGKVGFVAIEGPKGNPNASDLMAEAYNIIRVDRQLADTVFSAEAEAIQVGQGCASVSFAMSDAQLSAITASMSTIVSAADRTGLPINGALHLGALGADGVSQSWSQSCIAPWIIVKPAVPTAPSARISSHVHAAIQADVANWPGVETGGVLVGRFSTIGNAFQVVDLIPAPPDSKRTLGEFLLGIEGLKAKIAQLIRASRGTLQVIGTWHSHLVASGPSGLDARTGALLASAQLSPLLLLIHTPAGYSMLTAEAFDPALIDPRAIKAKAGS
jgi:hypothetical protein